MPASLLSKTSTILLPLQLVLPSFLLNLVRADEGPDTVPECTTTASFWDVPFAVWPWLARGICIRQNNDDGKCYQALLDVLGPTLNPLRIAEYNGAAGVLALLPTIGALLGAPTNEIWRLLTIVPFGGVMAMFLSFGGAIVPARVEDYEPAFNKELHADSSFSLRKKRGTSKIKAAIQADETEMVTQNLLRKISKRLHSPDSVKFKKTDIWIGFLGMFALFILSQGAITVTEQGALLPWWCVSRTWMHTWYFLVTICTILENSAQLPFCDEFKLFLSDVPYDITVTGGEDITQSLADASGGHASTISADSDVGAAIERAIGQLKTITPGIIHIESGTEVTSARNTLLVIISVIRNESDEANNRHSTFWGSLWRLLTKAMSIGVFVTGTAFFASVQLLAQPMAVMVVTLLLAAAVFSRAIASWITMAVGASEPMLHVIVNSRSEAYQVMARIMLLTRDNARAEISEAMEGARPAKRPIQIELNGHVFVNCKRVASRSKLWLNVLGIMASPYDLAKKIRKAQRTNQSYQLLPMTTGSSSVLKRESRTDYEVVDLS